jgi:hypothetical protein
MFLLVTESLLINLLNFLLHLIDFPSDGGESLLDGVLELIGDHVEVLLLYFFEFVDFVAEEVLALQFLLELLDGLLVLFDLLAEVGVLCEGVHAVVAAFLEDGDEVFDVEELFVVEFLVAAEVVLF